MLKKDLEEYKTLLIKNRESLSGDIDHIKDENLKQSHRDATGDLSGYSYHMADVATDNYEREMSLDLASNDQDILYKIDEALKKIEEGTYGTCQDCGANISKKRLRAVPYAQFCIRCQKNNEEKQSANEQ